MKSKDDPIAAAFREHLCRWLLAMEQLYGADTAPALVLQGDGSGCIRDAHGGLLFEFGCFDALDAHLELEIENLSEEVES